MKRTRNGIGVLCVDLWNAMIRAQEPNLALACQFDERAFVS